MLTLSTNQRLQNYNSLLAQLYCEAKNPAPPSARWAALTDDLRRQAALPAAPGSKPVLANLFYCENG